MEGAERGAGGVLPAGGGSRMLKEVVRFYDKLIKYWFKKLNLINLGAGEGGGKRKSFWM